MPTIAEGQFLVRVIWLSLDPAMRGWIAAGANYSTPVPLDTPMTGFTVGEVVESRHPDFTVGEIVQGRQAGAGSRSRTAATSTARLTPRSLRSRRPFPYSA